MGDLHRAPHLVECGATLRLDDSRVAVAQVSVRVITHLIRCLPDRSGFPGHRATLAEQSMELENLKLNLLKLFEPEVVLVISTWPVSLYRESFGKTQH